MVERTGTRELCIGKVDKDPTSGTIQNESVDYDNSIIFHLLHNFKSCHMSFLLPCFSFFMPVDTVHLIWLFNRDLIHSIAVSLVYLIHS